MKITTCPCGAQFKTHTADEGAEHAILHVRMVHQKEFPKGLARDEALKMVKEA